MTRRQLMESIDTYELEEWEAFWMLEGGFGDLKQDRRLGQVCSIIANVNRNPGKQPMPYKIDDFDLRPRVVDLEKDKTASIKAGFDVLAAMGSGKKKKKRKG